MQQILSISKIGEYLKCGWQYKNLYIDKIPRPKSWYMVRGSVVDNVITYLYQHNLKVKKDDIAEITKSNLEAEIESAKKEQGIEWEDEKPEHIIEQSVEILTKAQKEILPKFKPSAIQMPFNKQIDENLTISGRLDLIQLDKSFVDWKVSESNKDYDLQFFGYGFFLYQDTPIKAYRVNLYRLLNGRDTTKEYLIEKHHVEHFVNIAKDVAKAINLGVFPRTSPDNWMCSKNWCPIYAECRGSF